jgi:YD repeat-containing protein
MIDIGLNLNVAYKAAPFVLGSGQDTTPMQLVYQGAPFLIANQERGFSYTMDVLGRLTKTTITQGTTQQISYDASGNRTSVVTTCGPSGC